MSSSVWLFLCTLLHILTKADWGMEIKVSDVFSWIKGFAKLISSVQNVTLLYNFCTASLKMFTTHVHMCFHFVVQVTHGRNM